MHQKSKHPVSEMFWAGLSVYGVNDPYFIDNKERSMLQCIAIRSYHFPRGKITEYFIIRDIFSNKMEHQHINPIDIKIGVKITFINLFPNKEFQFGKLE